MTRALTVLIVSPDARLEDEVVAALRGTADEAAVLHYVPDYRQAVEEARSRHPDLVLVEMTTDIRALKALSDEVARGSPGTAVAAVFSKEVFGDDTSEGAVLIEAVRAGVQDFLRRPLSRADVRQLFDRLTRRRAAAPPPRAGRVVSFVSNKGGVGKSTLAVNVACGLARLHPGRVLLIDASIQMGVCADLLDLKPATSLTDAAEQRDRLDETLVRQLAVPHSSGLHLLAAPPGAVEAAAIDDALLARVITLARRAYDFVFVDTFPMLDPVILAVLDLSDRAYVVVEGVVPTVLGAARLVTLLESIGVRPDRQRVVVNRYTGGSDNLSPADVGLRLGREVAHVVPFTRRVAVAANIGRPYVLDAPRWWGFGKAVRKVVAEIDALPARRLAARRAASDPTPTPTPQVADE